MTSTEPKPLFYLGVDGGGSGCRARLESETGEVLGQGASGPATVRFGVAEAWSAVLGAAQTAIREAGLSAKETGRVSAGIGLAGFGRKGTRAAMEAIGHPFRYAVFVDDAYAACVGAHAGRDGAIVIIGTGSIGRGIVDGREIRIGGYGFPASDEASGAHIGLRVVQLALRARDGRIPATPLLDETMRRFDDDVADIIGWTDRATATDYARLAPMVMQHAEQGDPSGALIAGEAAREVEAIVTELHRRGAADVVLMGGLAAPLTPWLSKEIGSTLTTADGDAVQGGIILARRAT